MNIVGEFYLELRNHSLRRVEHIENRNSETFHYTLFSLGDSKLDKLFSLDNSAYHGVANQTTMILMSAVISIMGMKGFTPDFIFGKLIEDYKVYNSGDNRNVLNESLNKKLDEFPMRRFAIANACSTDYIGTQLTGIISQMALKKPHDLVNFALERTKATADIVTLNSKDRKEFDNKYIDMLGMFV